MEMTGDKGFKVDEQRKFGRPKGAKGKGGERMVKAFLNLQRQELLDKYRRKAHARVKELLIAAGVDPEQIKGTASSLLPLLSPTPAVTLGITEILTKMEATVTRLSDTTKYPVRTRNRKKKPKPDSSTPPVEG